MSAQRTKVFVDIITRSDGKEPGAGLKKFAIGAGVAALAVAGLIKVGKELVTIFAVQEQAEAKLIQTIKSTGKAAGLTADQLFDMASGLQEVTKFGDEAIIGAETLLLTFKDIGGDIFPRALESILDVSEAMGTGLKESTIQLGKALNDPIQGLTALRRVGIQFSDTQEDLIKGFVKNNDLASAQEIILGELESQFGGVARAAADTATGSFTQLGNTVGDLQEAYGALVANGMQPLNEALTTMISKWATALEQQRQAIDFAKDLKDGTIDEVRSLGELEDILSGLEKQRGQAGRGGFVEDEIIAVKELIANYDHVNDRINRNAASELLYANILNDKATIVKAIAVIEESARDTLLQLQFDALTAEEKQIQLLDEEIDKYAELRSQGADVQELLNFLVGQRNDLLKDEGDILEGLIFDWETFDGVVSDSLKGQIDLVDELNQTYVDLAETGLGAFAQAFKDVGAGNIELWEGFKEAGKGAVSALLEALAKMAIIEAAIAAASLRFGKAGLLLVAASAAYAASGFVQSLPTGGQFITDGPTIVGNTLVGDNASGQERITVEPLGGGGGNNTGQIMILRVGDRDLKAVVQGWIDNRGLHSSFGGAI